MNTEWVLLISIILQVAAALAALRLIPITARRGAWLLISTALLFMTLRRGISFVQGIVGEVSPPAGHYEEWVALITSALFLGGIVWIGPLFRSIKDTVESLRESEERYRSFFDNSMDAVVITDLDGHVLAANPMACERGGWDRTEVGSLRREDLIDGSDPRVVVFLAERSRESKARGELTGIRKDGSRFPIEVTSALFRDKDGQLKAINISRDITERKQAEEALRLAHAELEQRVLERTIELSQANEQLKQQIKEREAAEAERMLLATAVHQAAEGIIIANAQHVIQYVNPAFQRMSGYSKDELIGHSITLIESGQHAPEYYRKVSDTLARGEAWSGHFINKKKDGSAFEVEVTISPIRDQTGEIAHHVAVERDVTEEVKLEQELRRAQQMEAIGTLARGIAHDFNNLLATIMAQTEMALSDLTPGHPARNNCEVVLEASRQARDLVKQILTLSRRNHQELVPTLLAPLVMDCLDLFCKSLPMNIELCVSIIPPADTANVKVADAGQIQQVLFNLCGNAADAMREHGGTLDVSLECVGFMPTVGMPQSEPRSERFLRLTVRDTGLGIEHSQEDDLERIFEPYFSTKPHGKGSGLGLAVVYNIVTGLGGVITVDSQPGVGSSFQVFLPCVELEGGASWLAS
jgi:PAS domain S-box-containing protein